MSQTPIVDENHLASFTGGDPKAEQELWDLYLLTADSYLESLRQASTEPEPWQRAAHSLKGASANMGAQDMARLAAEAEREVPNDERVAVLKGGLERLRRVIDERQQAS
ncbi:MAG: Hpt domain-containing protein [Geminicoccaceae bacterium]